jgi:uncharacterized protein (DUF58 family)
VGLLTQDDALLLDRLALGDRGIGVSPAPNGVRRARTRGAGSEFHGYRPYQPGDDLRGIDWTVEARLRQLVVRVPRAEGHLRLHVLVDISGSMGLGTPSKLTCATHAAAALCYVAVGHRDAAGVAAFRDRITTGLPPAEGRGQLLRALEMLERFTPAGVSDIDGALEHYAAAAPGPGVAAVLSDFFQPGGGLQGLQSLLSRGLVPAVVQIVAPEEIAPDLPEDTELIDVEDASFSSLVVDGTAIDAYRARLAEHEALLREFCGTHGCPWARIRSDMSFRELLWALEASGILAAAL